MAGIVPELVILDFALENGIYVNMQEDTCFAVELEFKAGKYIHVV